MNCVAVCQDDLIVMTLHEALAPTLDIEFLVEDRPQGRRLGSAGIPTRVGDPYQIKTYLKANVTAAGENRLAAPGRGPLVLESP